MPPLLETPVSGNNQQSAAVADLLASLFGSVCSNHMPAGYFHVAVYIWNSINTSDLQAKCDSQSRSFLSLVKSCTNWDAAKAAISGSGLHEDASWQWSHRTYMAAALEVSKNLGRWNIKLYQNHYQNHSLDLRIQDARRLNIQKHHPENYPAIGLLQVHAV